MSRFSPEEEEILARLGCVTVECTVTEEDQALMVAQQVRQFKRDCERDDSDWRLAAMKAVRNIARSTEHFTARAVTLALKHEPVQSRSKQNLGIVLAAAKKRGYIENDGLHKREGDKYPTVMWRSCLLPRRSKNK